MMPIIKIKKNIDFFIIAIILLQLVFLKYNGYEQIGNKMLTAFIGLTLLKHFHTVIKEKTSILILALIGTVFLINIIMRGASIGNIKSNLAMLLYPVFSVFFLGYFIKKYPDQFRNMMIKSFWWINVYFILNVIVLLIQLQGTGFMVGVNAAGTENPMYEDLIAGLLGYSGTHQLSLFFVFVILYNLNYWMYIVKSHNRAVLLVYIIASALFTLYISIQNYNQAYFFIMPLAFVVFMVSHGIDEKNTKIPWKTVMKYMFIVLVVLGALVVLYHKNANIKNLIDENIFKQVDIVAGASQLGLEANGSDERFAMVFYGLENYNGWTIGMGLGNYFIYEAGALGFKHFGQASMGTLICLGGIWFVLLLLIYNVYIVQKILFKENGVIGFVLVSVYYIFLAFYCQIFYDNIVALWGIIALLPIRWAREEKERQNISNQMEGDFECVQEL